MYEVGDKVLVRPVGDLSQEVRDYMNGDGLMDHWSGKIVTIRQKLKGSESFGGRYHIEEDIGENGNGWYWLGENFEPITENKCVVDADKLLSFI